MVWDILQLSKLFLVESYCLPLITYSCEALDYDTANNLQLNRNKSSEVVFVRPRNRKLTIPPPAVPGIYPESGASEDVRCDIQPQVLSLLTCR